MKRFLMAAATLAVLAGGWRYATRDDTAEQCARTMKTLAGGWEMYHLDK